MTGTKTDGSFDALEEQLDALDAAGVPQDWAKAFKDVRAELKSRRERYSPYEKAFGALDENAAKVLLAVAETLPKDPEAVGRWALQTAQDLGGDKFTPWLEEAGLVPAAAPTVAALDSPAGDDKELSIEERIEAALEARLKARDEEAEKRAALEREHRRIEAKLEELGYRDPAAEDAQLVLLRAKNLGGDPLEAIQQAHDGLAEFYVDKAKNYISSKAPDGAGESPDGLTPQDDDPLPIFDDAMSAEDRMRARLDVAFGQASDGVILE